MLPLGVSSRKLWAKGDFQKLSYISEMLLMTIEGMGEMFEVELQTCAPKYFQLCRVGDERPSQPPSARAEIYKYVHMVLYLAGTFGQNII